MGKKKGWKPVSFGDVVRDVKESESDPLAVGLERYIGLEHIEPKNFHITEWGDLNEDEVSFKKRFRKGQVLFGKRRAYQRKVALAEFDGVCSSDILTFEPKNGEIISKLLPFIVRSEDFFDHALDTSSGSLSPRTRWSQLKDYKFYLPELSQQKLIATTLWAADSVLHHFNGALASCRRLKDIVVSEFLATAIGGDGIRIKKDVALPSGWKLLTGQQLLDNEYLTALQDGNHGGQYPRAHEFSDSGHPYLSATQIDEAGNVDLESCPKLPESRANQLRIPPAQGGDVILTNNATVGRVGLLPDDAGTVVVSTSTTYYRIGNGLERDYLVQFLRSPSFQWQLHRVMMQSTRNQVPITTQKKLLFIVPPEPDQRSISKTLAGIQSRIQLLEAHCELLATQQELLINELLKPNVNGGGA